MFLFDWFSFTTKTYDICFLKEILGLDDKPWEECNGLHGYKDGLKFGNIRICYNPGKDNMGILVSMSGQGCREFESYGTGDFDSLFKLILDNPDDLKITRLDVAFDDMNRVLPLKVMGNDVRKGNYVSNWSEYSVRESSKGYTIEIGSSKSEAMITFYDKAAERGLDSTVYWVRAELLLRRDRARNFIEQFIYGGYNDDLGELFCGVMKEYLRFVVPSKSDSDKRRWNVRPYWSKFLKECLPVHLYSKPGVEYNIFNLDRFVFGMAGGGIDTMIQVLGKDKFFEKLEEQRKIRYLNPKYKKIIDENGRYEELHKSKPIVIDNSLKLQDIDLDVLPS